jgi:hypothetical protein
MLFGFDWYYTVEAKDYSPMGPEPGWKNNLKKKIK